MLVCLLLAGCGGDAASPDTAPRELPVRNAAVPVDGPTVRVRPVVDRRTAVIVGDSITAAAGDAIAARAESADVSVLVDAEVGRRIAGGVSPEPGTVRLQAIRGRYATPDVWVIALGTNDVPGYDDADDYARLIDTLLAEIPAGDPLLWVNVYLAGAPERSDTFNTTLEQMLARRGNARVVDWRTTAPEDGVLSDGVHPTTDVGVSAFADLVVDAIVDRNP